MNQHVKHLLLGFGIAFFAHSAAFAGTDYRAFKLTPQEKEVVDRLELKDRKAVQAELESGRFQGRVNVALDALVDRAILLLRHEGHEDLANKYEGEWNHLRSSLGAYDLGDHKPLSKWLDTFYQKVESVLGKKICNFFFISDIKVFNFGIPVVLHPKFNPEDGSEWGLDEYQKHFIPVTSAVAYWSADLVCSSVLPFPASFACRPIARVNRLFIKKLVAPSAGRAFYKMNN